MIMREIITRDSEETKKLGEKFAKEILSEQKVCLSPMILALYGNLGGGKTTFVQGLAKGLGIKKRIISPTFVIIRSYESYFYHADLYRLRGEEDIEGTGL